MTKYQIRFCDSKGHGSFSYIDVKSKKGVEQKAADEATKYINRQCESWRSFSAPKAKRIVHVWEMDMETNKPKNGGHRFKLELYFTEITYGSGRKIRNEWYEPHLKIQELEYENERLREALLIVQKWQLPSTGKFWDKEETQPMSYGACYGSNGERDYMKAIANNALNIKSNDNGTTERNPR